MLLIALTRLTSAVGFVELYPDLIPLVRQLDRLAREGTHAKDGFVAQDTLIRSTLVNAQP